PVLRFTMNSTMTPAGPGPTEREGTDGTNDRFRREPAVPGNRPAAPRGGRDPVHRRRRPRGRVLLRVAPDRARPPDQGTARTAPQDLRFPAQPRTPRVGGGIRPRHHRA